MDNDTVVEILNKEKGRVWDLAKAVIDCKNASWSTRDEHFQILSDLLLEGNPKTLGEVYDNGPRRLFAAVYGEEVAALVGAAVSRLNRYVHSPSAWRRSFRTQAIVPYLDRFAQILKELLFFPWEHFDMVRDLTTPQKEDDNDNEKAEARRFPPWLYGDFIALRIDGGDADVINAVRDICLGDNNTRLLSHAVINGMVKSQSPKMHKLLGDVLLAAKLQEGLRQAILENADNGTAEAFIYLIKLVIDNDLIRYSSALRALDVWLGLGETFEDKRTAAKLLGLCYAYLTDTKALAAGLESKDLTEIYAALWALSVREMNDVVKPLEKLLAGEKYKRLAALYFANHLENKALQFTICSRIIAPFAKTPPGAEDLDLLALTLAVYPVSSSHIWERRYLSEGRGANPWLGDKHIRDEHFNAFINILPAVPPKGHDAGGKPFPWCGFSLKPDDICVRLLRIAGWDFDGGKIARLMEIMPLADSTSRAAFVRFFLEKPAGAKERDFLFAALNDKSMSVRTRALENVLALSGAKAKEKGTTEKADKAEAKGETTENAAPLSATEEKLVADLLALKTGDLRQNCVKILLALPGDRPVEAAKTLVADKNENRRLGGLDMITQLVNGGVLDREAAAALIALMPARSPREEVIIKALGSETSRYTKANGFGLYDPDYRPVFPKIEVNKKHTMESIFGLSFDRAQKIFSSLCETIREHKDYTYAIHNYDGDVEVALGGLRSPRSRAEANDDKDLSMFERFVLREVWRGWIKKTGLGFDELCYFMFASEVKDYSGVYELDYLDWAKKIIEDRFHAKEADRLIRWMAKQEYGPLALGIMEILETEFPAEERFAALSGALADLIASVDGEDWKKAVEGENPRRYGNHDADTLADTEEVNFLVKRLGKTRGDDDGRFKTYTAFCFELGRLSGMFYRNLEPVDIARGIELGILRRDVLVRTMFLTNPRNLGGYAGKIRWDDSRKDVEKYPLLKTVADEAAARVIEIELDRGDSETEVSRLALAIAWHEGAETFVKLLTALGDETFVRGYIYSGAGTKKAVLSSLLKASHPRKDAAAPDGGRKPDSAETLRAALENTGISEKRLVEAAMYAPAWLDIVGDYLGWPGLRSAAWYFHAHINESFSAEKETEVARYSPISPEEFNDGAFDI
ncbi:MAG: DUF5724 domain-containing protein, partial [Treponema sp.]|nr:DUF5724 domain-containing protein [Treponema sp.]